MPCAKRGLPSSRVDYRHGKDEAFCPLACRVPRPRGYRRVQRDPQHRPGRGRQAGGVQERPFPTAVGSAAGPCFPPEDTGTLIPEAAAKGGATYSQFKEQPRGEQGPRPATAPSQMAGIRVEHEGDLRWLLIPQPPDVVWPEVREFFVKNGLTIKVENPAIGIMETDWAETVPISLRATCASSWARSWNRYIRPRPVTSTGCVWNEARHPGRRSCT